MKKQNTLKARESELRNELEEVSSTFEVQVKRAVTISLISGGVVLAGYFLYKKFAHKEPAPEPKSTKATDEQQVVKVESSFSFKKLLLEKAALAAVQFVGAQLAVMLSRKMGTNNTSEGEDD